MLYAEDNGLDADLTRAHLEANGPEFELDVVRTGEECLARLQAGRYDLVLLDNHLPDLDGIEVLEELAAQRIRLPVVMTTAVGDESLAVQVLRLGASDYLPKDGDYLARLPQVLRNAIAEHRKEQEPQHAGERSRRRILYAEHDPVDVDLTLRHFAEVRPYFEVKVVASAAGAPARRAPAFERCLSLRYPATMPGNLIDRGHVVKKARIQDLTPFLHCTGV